MALWLAFYVAIWLGAYRLGSGSSRLPTHAAPEEIVFAETDAEAAAPAIALSMTEAVAIARASCRNPDEFLAHYTGLYLAKRLDSGGLLEALRAAGRFDGEHALVIRLILALELANRDPARAENALTDPRFGADSGLNFGYFFEYWAKSHPEAAIACAAKLAEPARDAAISGLSRSGNQSAMDFAAQHGATSEDTLRDLRAEAEAALAREAWREPDSGFRQLMLGAYASDPASGLRAAARIEDSHTRSIVIGDLLEVEWPNPEALVGALLSGAEHGLARDPARFIGHMTSALNAPGDSDKSAAFALAVSGLTRDQQTLVLANLHMSNRATREAALRSPLLLEAPDSPAKNEAMLNAVVNIGFEDVGAALDLARQELKGPALDRALQELVRSAAHGGRIDVAAGLTHLIRGEQQKGAALATLAEAWTEKDPLGFLEWAAEHPDPRTLERTMPVVARAWIQSDLEEAKDFATSLPPGPAASAFHLAIARHLATSEPWAGVDYAAELEDESIAREIVQEAMRALARSEPRAALEFLETGYDGPEFDSIRDSAAQVWARNDPGAAIRHFEKTSDDARASRGLFHCALLWLGQDRASATAYLREMPAGPRSDAVFATFARNNLFASQQSELAASLVSRIQDPEIRAEAEEALKSNRVFNW